MKRGDMQIEGTGGMIKIGGAGRGRGGGCVSRVDESYVKHTERINVHRVNRWVTRRRKDTILVG